MMISIFSVILLAYYTYRPRHTSRFWFPHILETHLLLMIFTGITHYIYFLLSIWLPNNTDGIIALFGDFSFMLLTLQSIHCVTHCLAFYSTTCLQFNFIFGTLCRSSIVIVAFLAQFSVLVLYMIPCDFGFFDSATQQPHINFLYSTFRLALNMDSFAKVSLTRLPIVHMLYFAVVPLITFNFLIAKIADDLSILSTNIETQTYLFKLRNKVPYAAFINWILRAFYGFAKRFGVVKPNRSFEVVFEEFEVTERIK